jgi:hypothetical protein
MVIAASTRDTKVNPDPISPIDPGTPGGPGIPVNPVTPVNPGTPDESGTPADPGTPPVQPAITIITQPTAEMTVTAGSISGSLSVAATVTEGATLSYQWYSNTLQSNTGGRIITGAASSSFALPTDLIAGTYYYYCEVRATGGAIPVISRVAKITVLNGDGDETQTQQGSSGGGGCSAAGGAFAVMTSAAAILAVKKRGGK